MARLRQLAFPALRGIVVALAAPLAACTTASLQDAMPVSAQAQSAAAAPQSAYTGPDGYPDLNVPMQAAAPQITDEDFQTTSAALRARREGLAARAAGPGMSAEDLRRIGASHGEETLDAIESQ